MNSCWPPTCCIMGKAAHTLCTDMSSSILQEFCRSSHRSLALVFFQTTVPFLSPQESHPFNHLFIPSPYPINLKLSLDATFRQALMTYEFCVMPSICSHPFSCSSMARLSFISISKLTWRTHLNFIGPNNFQLLRSDANVRPPREVGWHPHSTQTSAFHGNNSALALPTRLASSLMCVTWVPLHAKTSKQNRYNGTHKPRPSFLPQSYLWPTSGFHVFQDVKVI